MAPGWENTPNQTMPMPPPDKNKRILVLVASIVIPIGMAGCFLWSFFKDFFNHPASGKGHGSNVPLIIFGVIFCLFILVPIVSAVRTFRRQDWLAAHPDAPPPPASNRGATVFMFLFSLPFAGFGVVALVQGVRKAMAGDWHNAGGLGVFGLIFTAVGLGIMWLAIRTQKQSRAAADASSAHPHNPWRLRPDWAAGYCKSLIGSQAKIMMLMAFAFCLIGGLQTVFVLPKELHQGNQKALVILIFPAVGIGLLVPVIQAARVRRRFGLCVFKPAAIPVPLGGALSGVIQTGTRVKLEQGLHLKLSCIRRTVSGSGDDRNTREDVLWQEEKVFTPSASLPEPEPGHSAIPVYFKLPAGQPQCLDGNPAIVWRLEAKAKMTGPSFAATFEVPVFQVAGAPVVAPEAPDPTAALQMPEEEVRRVEHSKIQVSNVPGGREFYFPAARNLGMAAGLTAFLLIWSGFFYFMLSLRAPVIFPIIWGVIDVLLVWSCFNVWFKSSRVTVNGTAVTAINRWLVFSRTRQFEAGEVSRIELKNGMTSGSQVYSDLQLILRNGKKATIADLIPSRAEADWLAREMMRAVGRGGR